jgi:hypothetical protein
MHPLKIDAIVASAWNIVIGQQLRGDNMTPAKAAALPASERISVVEQYRDANHPDRLYTVAECEEALRGMRALVGA